MEKRYAVIEGESLAVLYGVMANRMYLYGLEFTVVIDHQPLVTLYNNPKLTGLVRIEQHRLKLQGYNFQVMYRKGTINPTDYNSRHPIQISELPTTEKDSMEITTEVGFFVNAVINQDVPDAMTLEILQKATNKSNVLAKLKYCILK